MAGYPTTVTNFTDNFGAAFTIGLIAVFMPLAAAIKVFLLIALILFPVIMFFSCRNFSFSIPESLLAGLVLIFALNSFNYYIQVMPDGWYSFISSAFMASFTFSCLCRYLRNGEKKALAYFIIAGWYTLSLHPLSAVILASLGLIYFIFDYKAIFTLEFKHLVLAGLFILLANLYWIVPLLRFRAYYEPILSYHQAFGLSGFLEHFIWTPRYIIFKLLIFCSILAPILFEKKDKKRPLILSFFFCLLLMFFISYFSVGPLRAVFAHMEPARFSLVLVILAPVLIAQFFSKILANRIKFANAFFCLALFSQLCVSRLLAPEFENNEFIRSIKKILCPALCPSNITVDIMRNGGEGLINKILDLTDNSGRVLVEDAGIMRAYWNSHFLSILPLSTGREFIGGPYHNTMIKHRFATFVDGEIFSKPIESIEIKTFMEYMDLYNIKWAFIYSRASKEYFRSHPEYFRYLSSYKARGVAIDTYSIERKPSFFIKGGGDIKASLDRITIKGTSKGDIIIKYHYLETLKTRQKLKIEEYKMMDDPIGFIKINNDAGYDTIEIYN